MNKIFKRSLVLIVALSFIFNQFSFALNTVTTNNLSIWLASDTPTETPTEILVSDEPLIPKSETLNILVLNCGSSSVKYQVFNMPSKEEVVKRTTIDADEKGDEAPTHETVIKEIMEKLKAEGIHIHAVGHRVVHGGEDFTGSVLINDAVKKSIKANIPKAPLHNPANLIGIEAAESVLPGVPQIAVFDTAVHQNMPPKAYRYAIPEKLYKEYGIRRYGFHGTSHFYVANEAIKLINIKRKDNSQTILPFNESKLITVHLGNGASIASWKNGKVIDTSMGFTPLEGLVMGTRSGTIDPAIILFLATQVGMDANEIDNMLNKKSGLLALSGVSKDMREVIAAAEKGDKRAKLALEVFIYTIQKFIGQYYSTIGKGGADAIVFTGGIGENSEYIRDKVMEGLQAISENVEVMAIQTNEELVIAEDTYEIIHQKQTDPVNEETHLFNDASTVIHSITMPWNSPVRPGEKVIFAGADTWVDDIDPDDILPVFEKVAQTIIKAANIYEKETGKKAVIGVLSYSTTKRDTKISKDPYIQVMELAVQRAKELKPDLIIVGNGSLQFDAAILENVFLSKTKSETVEENFPPNVFIFPHLPSLGIGRDIIELMQQTALSKQKTEDDFFADCEKVAKTKTSRIVIPEATNVEILKAVEQYLEKEIGEVVLLGEETEILEIAQNNNINIGKAKIVSVINGRENDKGKIEDHVLDTYAKLYCKALGKGDSEQALKTAKTTIRYQLKKKHRRALFQGAQMVASGEVDCMVAGKVYDSDEVILAIKMIVGTKDGVKSVSGGFLMSAPYQTVNFDGNVILSDIAFEVCPDTDKLADIAINTARDIVTYTGNTPKVAFVSDEITDSEKIENAIKQTREVLGKAVTVDGVMSINTALQQGYNAIIFADLSSGNIGYKMIQRMGKFSPLAIVTGGSSKPVFDMSRGADANEIYASMVLASRGKDDGTTQNTKKVDDEPSPGNPDTQNDMSKFAKNLLIEKNGSTSSHFDLEAIAKEINGPKVKILFSDDPAKIEALDSIQQKLNEIFGDKVQIVAEHGGGKDEQWLRDKIVAYKPDIIIVRSGTKKPLKTNKTEIFQFAKKHGVKAIIRAGAGYKNIDVDAAKQQDISVLRTHGNANSVADLTLFLLATLNGRISTNKLTANIQGDMNEIVKTQTNEYFKLIEKSKKWGDISDSNKVTIIENWKKRIFGQISSENQLKTLAKVLQGKTIGILGFGSIPQILVEKLDAIRVLTGVSFNIVVHSRSLQEDDSRASLYNFDVVTREDLFKLSHIVSVHLPEIKELALTLEEIHSPLLQAIINTSRTELVPPDLINDFIEVKNGVYMGDLDIIDDLEKLTLENIDNVVIFPHIGASTADAAEGVEKRTTETLLGVAEKLLDIKIDNEETEIEIVNETDIKPLSSVTEEEVEQIVQVDKTNIWEAVNLLHNGQMEILVPQEMALTFEIKKFLKEINKRHRKEIVHLTEYSSMEHLEQLLSRQTNNEVKRMVLTDFRSSDEFQDLIDKKTEKFQGIRVLSFHLPENYYTRDSKIRAFEQYDMIMIAILARLLEQDKTPMVETVLKQMLQAHTIFGKFLSEQELNEFIDNLRSDDLSEGIAQIKKRLLFFLKKPVGLINQLQKNVTLMREFWTSA